MKSEKEKERQKQGPQRPPLRANEVIHEQLRRHWQRQLLGHLTSGNVRYADRDR